VDAFVARLDLDDLGFERAVAAHPLPDLGARSVVDVLMAHAGAIEEDGRAFIRRKFRGLLA